MMVRSDRAAAGGDHFWGRLYLALTASAAAALLLIVLICLGGL